MASEILDRYVKVTGGPALWHAAKSERVTIEGRALDDNRIVLSATISTTRSGNSRSEVHVPQEAAEGVYKGVAWAVSRFSGVRIKHGVERDEAIRDSHMLEEADWRSLYPSARLAGIETVGGRRCYKVQFSAGITEWFDIETGLLARRVSSEQSSSGATLAGFTVEQWSNRGGLKQPSKMLAFRGDFEYRLSVVDAVYNQPASVEYPAEVAGYLAAERAGKALPNAEEIVERHIFESGGADAYLNLKTQQVTGALTFLSSNTEARVETWAAPDGKYFQTIDMPGLGKQEEGSDGLVSWERSPALGPRVKLRGAVGGLSITQDAAQVVGWRFLIEQVRTEALETVDSRECYRVRLTTRKGSQVLLRWYDKQSGLLYRSSSALASDMGALPMVLTIEEYRDADGLKWPVRIRMEVSGQELLFTATDVKLNQPVEDTIFQLPSEIKELAQKKSDGSL